MVGPHVAAVLVGVEASALSRGHLARRGHIEHCTIGTDSVSKHLVSPVECIPSAVFRAGGAAVLVVQWKFPLKLGVASLTGVIL